MSNQASLRDISSSGSSESQQEKSEEDWTSEKVGDIFKEIKSGGTPKRGKEEYWEDGTIPFVKIEDLNRQQGEGISDAEECTTEKAIEDGKTRIYEPGTILLTIYGTIGETGIVTEPVSTNQGIIGLWNPEDTNIQFARYAFDFEQEKLASKKRETTQANIGKNILKLHEISHPPLPEQRRIASVLYNVDQAIQKTEEIIDQTQRVKKGLMQDLFTEGYYDHEEFKDKRLGPRKLSIPENWSIKKISDFADIKGGKRLPKSHSYAKMKTNHPYLRVKDFKGGGIDQRELKYLKPETYEEISRYTISSEDAYISIAGTLGIAGTIPENLDGANLTENAAKITNIEGVDNEYLALYLQSSYGQKEVHRFTVGSTQPKLSLFRIRKMEALVPPIEEQERIVETVKSAKRIIDKFKKEKEKFQRLKKGLMQDLLTGEVRTDESVEVLDEVVEVES